VQCSKLSFRRFLETCNKSARPNNNKNNNNNNINKVYRIAINLSFTTQKNTQYVEKQIGQNLKKVTKRCTIMANWKLEIWFQMALQPCPQQIWTCVENIDFFPHIHKLQTMDTEPNTVVGKIRQKWKTSYLKFVVDKTERKKETLNLMKSVQLIYNIYIYLFIYIPTDEYVIIFIVRLTAWSLQCVSQSLLYVSSRGFFSIQMKYLLLFRQSFRVPCMKHGCSSFLLLFTQSDLDATMIPNVLASYMVKPHYFYHYHSSVPIWAVL
jgi:hypothetical protein